MIRSFTISRRAYGHYTSMMIFVGTWVDAMDRASKMRIENECDGEYFVFNEGEELRDPVSVSPHYQSGLDYL